MLHALWINENEKIHIHLNTDILSDTMSCRMAAAAAQEGAVAAVCVAMKSLNYAAVVSTGNLHI